MAHLEVYRLYWVDFGQGWPKRGSVVFSLYQLPPIFKVELMLHQEKHGNLHVSRFVWLLQLRNQGQFSHVSTLVW